MEGALDRTIVVGAGLGGLLTGAFLATRGRPVLVLEALDFVGGRFTHVDYDGFAVPTGAFHALPGGHDGPLYGCLQCVGAAPELVVPEPSFWVRLGDRMFALDLSRSSQSSGPLREAVSLGAKWRLGWGVTAALAQSLLGADVSVEAAVRRTGGGPAAVRLFDHLAKFSLGVPAAEAAVTDVVRSLLAQRHGREGFLRDGNRAMCEALVRRIERGGAEVQTRRRVSAVVVAAGRVRGVRTADGAFLGAQQVISNAGAATTARLLGETAPPELRPKTEQAVPAWGAAHSIRARRRLQDHGSIEIPVDLDHIAGIVPLSNISPALCPADWHYSLAYQALDREADVPEQLDAARAELHAYLGQDAEIFNSAVYRGSHPAAATAQRVGQHGARRFPAALPGVGGLYMVGHDMAGYGIAAEIIGDSCRRLWRKLRW